MNNLAGKILIAPPSLVDNFWAGTVTLITEDNKLGTVGLTINKPSTLSVKEFARQNSAHVDLPGKVYIGGPVSTRALTLLHSPEWRCNNTLNITKDFSISSSSEILPKMAMGNVPNYWRVVVGLCRWLPGQLEHEILGNPPYSKNLSWVVATADQDLIFNTDDVNIWGSAIELAGSEFAQNFFAY